MPTVLHIVPDIWINLYAIVPTSIKIGIHLRNHTGKPAVFYEELPALATKTRSIVATRSGDSVTAETKM